MSLGPIKHPRLDCSLSWAFGLSLIFVTAVGCESKIEVDKINGVQSAASAVSLKPITAMPGDIVTITGSGFKSNRQKNVVKITSPSGDEVTAPATVTSDKEATFVMPEGVGLGLTSVVLESNGKQLTGSMPFVANLAGNTLDIFIGESSEICSTKQYIDRNGDTQTGTKNCSGTTADLTNLTPGNIKSGVTINGVTGTAALESHSNCSTDGGTSCVATASYPAALASGAAGKILSGQTLAGVSGNVTLPAASKVLTGTSYGVGGTGSSGSLTIPAAGNVVATAPAYGDSAAPTSPTLPARGTWNVTTSFPGAGYFAGISNAPAASTYTGTIIGTAGTATLESHSNCSTDGSTGCVTTSSFKAADMTNVSAGNIKSGVTIAGQAGSVTPAPANCSTDGGTSCVATASYPAALASGAASKILSGQTLAGVSGNVTLPAASKVLTGTSYGVGGTGSSGSLTIPAAGNVVATAPAYGDSAAPTTPTLPAQGTWNVTTSFPGAGYYAGISNAPAASTYTGTILGTAGTATLESHSNCSADGATGCVTTSSFKSANMTNVTAGNIKSGVTIAGQLGDYPSASNPLPGASGTADLDAATFNAKVKSSTAFEYWDSTGTRQTGAGDADITAANIASGVDIFSTTGTLTGGAAPNSWDLRAGVTVGGVTGKLKVNCRNKANPALFDIDQGQAATVTTGTPGSINITSHGFANNTMVVINFSTESNFFDPQVYYVVNAAANTFNLSTTLGGAAISMRDFPGFDFTVHRWQASPQAVDIWDTIDDYNNNTSGLPPNTVAGWSSNTDCGGVEVTAGDSNVWKDVTTNSGGTASNCTADAGRCTMQDKITGLWWSQQQTDAAWWQAITSCQSLNHNGQTGWRIPTQKELMDGYNHGIRSAASTNWITEVAMSANYFWSASSVSYFTATAWNVYLANGYTTSYGKNYTYQVVCVR